MGRSELKNRAGMHVDPFKWKKWEKPGMTPWFNLDPMLCFE